MHRFKDHHFRGQQTGEEIIKIVRRHWFNILQQYFIVFLLIVFIGGVFSFFNGFSRADLILMVTFFLMVAWIYSFIIWINYYFDVWIITNKRIVNIEQKSLFMRHISELKFSKIQDVSTEINGLIPTFLNYGEVYVQTAGSKGRFVFHNVPNPYAIKGTIMNLQTRFGKNESL